MYMGIPSCVCLRGHKTQTEKIMVCELKLCNMFFVSVGQIEDILLLISIP